MQKSESLLINKLLFLSLVNDYIQIITAKKENLLSELTWNGENENLKNLWISAEDPHPQWFGQ